MTRFTTLCLPIAGLGLVIAAGWYIREAVPRIPTVAGPFPEPQLPPGGASGGSATGATAAIRPRRETASEPTLSTLVHIRGAVVRNGHPVAGRAVVCAPGGRGPSQEQRTDAAGTFDFLARPGDHTLAVRHDQGEVEVGGTATRRRWPVDIREQPHAAARTVAVLDSDVTCDLALPTGTITVRLLDATTDAPIHHGGTIAWRAPAPVQERLRVKAAGGSCTLVDVAPGAHVLTGSARAYGTASATVTIDASRPCAAVDLRLDPSGAVDVVFVDATGAPLALSAAMQVRLLSPATTAVIPPINATAFTRSPRPLAFEFDDLMPDTYWPSLGSERAGGAIRFHPLELGGGLPPEIEVRPGEWRRVTVPARYRCHAVLRVVTRQGGAAATDALDVTWFEPANGPLRVLEAPWRRGAIDGATAFEGYLAPGDYEVACSSGTRRHAERLRIGFDDVERDIVVPW